MQNFSISELDLYVQIYGKEASYEFTWTATFTSEERVEIIMSIENEISGNGEEVYVEFPLTNQFKSQSNVSVDPDTYLISSLNKGSGSTGSASLGQTTTVLFLCSIGLSVFSSFGGNSLEMMWKFMNTIQLMYYISKINVHFPDTISTYFEYLQISNADNPYIRSFSFWLISDEHFTRGDVNEKIGSKSFYVTNADKLPWLVPVTLLFLIIKLIDILAVK